MFSSAPPSPDYKTTKEMEELMDSHIRQRSQSLTPIEDKIITNATSLNGRPSLRPTHKSAFSSFLTKSKKKQLSIQTTDLFERSCSDLSSSSSVPSTPLQIFKVDEDEADRIQLKNDLVKLAFDG
jgi:hypothetical protein